MLLVVLLSSYYYIIIILLFIIFLNIITVYCGRGASHFPRTKYLSTKIMWSSEMIHQEQKVHP